MNKNINTEESKSETRPEQLNIHVIIQRIYELQKEYYEVLEIWKKNKSFRKLDRLKEIEHVFKELKIDWLDDV